MERFRTIQEPEMADYETAQRPEEENRESLSQQTALQKHEGKVIVSETDTVVSSGVSRGKSDSLVINLDEVERETVEWLWQGHIPLGKIAVLDGDPGLGKSTITLDMAARVSTGSPFPEDVRHREPGNVLILSSEDGFADTIKPRLQAAGADLTRIVGMKEIRDAKEGTSRPLVLPRDMDELRRIIQSRRIQFVVIDPLVSFLDSSVNTNSDHDVRLVLYDLSQVGQDTGAAILNVRHLNKTAGTKAVYRGGGSIGIISGARVGMVVVKDPKDPDRRFLAITKCNIGKEAPTLAYRIKADETHESPVIEWGDVVPLSADALMLGELQAATARASERADEFLLEILADGPVAATEVVEKAKQKGISKRTLDRAKANYGIESKKMGGPDSAEQCWCWRRPEHCQKKGD